MDVKILGTGCAKCNKLEDTVKKALEELEIETDVDHITDFTQIAAYGVMSTPALVINNKVLFSGKVPKLAEVKKKIEANS